MELIKSSAFWGESKLLCSPLCRSLITADRWGRAGDQVLSSSSNRTKCLSPDRCSRTKVRKKQQCDIVLCALHRYACRAPFRISDLSCYLSTRKMRVRGRSSPSLHHTRDAPDQSQCHGPSRKESTWKISSEKKQLYLDPPSLLEVPPV